MQDRRRGGGTTIEPVDILDRRDASANAMRVLLATDGSADALRAASFIGSIIQPGSQVRLITVVSFEFYPDTLWGPPLSDAPERRKKARRIVEQSCGGPQQTLEAAGANVTVAQRFGRVAEEILQEATEWEADLIVVGRQGLTGPARWVLGSVSEYLVRHSAIPVLIVP